MKVFRVLFSVSLTVLLASVSSAQTIEVTIAQGLNAAIDFANQGNADTLMLVDGGDVGFYELEPATIESPMTIMGKPGLSTPPLIRAAASTDQNDFIRVKEDLTVIGVTIDGQAGDGSYAKFKYMFKINNPPADNPPNPEPKLTVMDSRLRNVYKTGDPATAVDGSFFDIGRTSYAKSLHFENVIFENSGDEAIRAINTHKEPVHPNNSAYGSLTVRNCTFININGTSIKIESDGDSTTVDAPVLLENLTFYKCQRRVIWERDSENTIIRNLIIANSKTGNDTFGGTDVLISFQRRGSVVSHIDTFMVKHIVDGDTVRLGSQAIVTKGGDWSKSNDEGWVEWTTIYEYDPMFADPENGDFTLLPGSKLYRLGHDGGPLGDRRWATNPPPPGVKIQVTPEQGLNAAIDFANAGNADTLELVTDGSSGTYELAPVTIEHPMVIMAAPGLSSPPVIKAAPGIDQNDYIRVKEDLTMIGLVIDGQTVAGDYGKFKYLFKINNPPDSNPINPAPRLRVVDCHLINAYKTGDPATAQDGSFFDISRTSYAGSVHFENTTFENSGDEAIRAINTHKDPVHPKNSAFGAMIVKNCTFVNINGSSIKIESDGDSTTVDAPVVLTNLTFYKCQRRVIWERDFENTIIRNLIITDSKTGNDTFGGSDVLISFQRRGSVLAYVDTFRVQRVADGDTVRLGPDPFVTKGGDWSKSSDAGTIIWSTIYGFDPMYVDPENGDFTLAAGSPAYTKGYDGKPLGDLRWATNPTAVRETHTDLVPAEFELSQNYPNPFNPSTYIRYSLKTPGHVKIQVYNIMGQLVETLVDDKKVAGTYTIQWIPKGLASGIYFYQMRVGGELLHTRKMSLLK